MPCTDSPVLSKSQVRGGERNAKSLSSFPSVGKEMNEKDKKRLG